MKTSSTTLLESIPFVYEDSQNHLSSTQGAATAPAAMITNAEEILANLLGSLNTPLQETTSSNDCPFPSAERSQAAYTTYKHGRSSYEEYPMGCSSSSSLLSYSSQGEHETQPRLAAEYPTMCQPHEVFPQHKVWNQKYYTTIPIITAASYGSQPSYIQQTSYTSNKAYNTTIPKLSYPQETDVSSNHLQYLSNEEQYVNYANSLQRRLFWTTMQQLPPPPPSSEFKTSHLPSSPACLDGSSCTWETIATQRDVTHTKTYADDRDRMVYVSWIPKRARAYNSEDKRRMELELKHRLREHLSFVGLTKVLLFPPKGVHCKLIFNW